MRTILIFFLFTGFVLFGYAQQFNPKFSVALHDSLSYHDLQWVDADNDSLLDVVVLAQNVRDEEVILFFKNDFGSGISFAGYTNTKFYNAVSKLMDFDGDNFVDMMVSGQRQGHSVTSALLNRGAFSFQSQDVINLAADIIRSGDLNGDGDPEILLSGNENGQPFLRILDQHASGWVVVHDSIELQAHDVEVSNFDKDNDVDFFVSGTDARGNTVNRVFYNQQGLYFKSESLVSGVRGTNTQADLNHDGYFDILLAGKDAANTDHVVTFSNSPSGFLARDSVMTIRDPEVFPADFNADGNCDIQLFGLLSSGDTLNAVYRNRSADNIAHTRVVTQSFGDYERDGDLDVLQLRRNLLYSEIVVLQNDIHFRNEPPDPPFDPVSATIFNRLFLSWEKPNDDHTDRDALTYDLTIQSSHRNLRTGDFDLMHGRRLLVTHGNNNTTNYVLLPTEQPGPFYFNIQAVDNSFHAGNGSMCKGSGGTGNPCVEIENVDLQACINESITIAADTTVRWYSFKDGFLMETRALNHQVVSADTIFSVRPRGKGCAVIKVYTIETPPELTKRSDSTIYACEGEIVHLGVGRGWSHIEWSCTATGFLSNQDSIEYMVTTTDTVSVKASNGMGCNIDRNTIVQVTTPGIDVEHDALQILKGESVQLHASGGDSYEWFPAAGLSDPLSSNPVASPLTTTEYTVTAKDSTGCAASARVVVVVEETAFIPNLFTPNHDGSNDVLKVYGLGQATDFSFTVYNREGSKVYHTNNISDALTNGWNGTVSGMEQPAGVYYWNVKGEMANGKPLQLNGKNSGSIVLVR